MTWLLNQMMTHLTSLKQQEALLKHHGILMLEDRRKLADIQDRIASTKERLSKHDVLYIS